MQGKFRNRTEAGQQLATKLTAYANQPDVLVLALPRGGVPVAYEVAKVLNAPLDICLVRKLGAPGNPELAVGAIATGGVRVLNDELLQELGISQEALDVVAAREGQELERRDRLYRGNRPFPDLGDSPNGDSLASRTIILVDDGIATGSTLRAALATLRQQQPKCIVVAVPVAPPSTCNQLKAEVDEVVCLVMPEPLNAISLWYEDFSQTTDAEVRNLLEPATSKQAPLT